MYYIHIRVNGSSLYVRFLIGWPCDSIWLYLDWSAMWLHTNELVKMYESRYDRMYF